MILKVYFKKEIFKHLNNKNILKHVLEIIPFEKHGLVDGGVSSYNSDILYDKFNGMFMPYLYKFCSMAGKNYRILDFWINIVEPGGYTKPHNHANVFPELKNVPQKVGVFYLQKPKESGNLYIENKLVTVKQNDMVIFDCNLNHHTEINKSKKQRIVFSVNMAENARKVFQDGKLIFLKESDDYKGVF